MWLRAVELSQVFKYSTSNLWSRIKHDCALERWERWVPEETGKVRAGGFRGENQLVRRRYGSGESRKHLRISCFIAYIFGRGHFPLEQTSFDVFAVVVVIVVVVDVVGFKLFKNDIWHFPRFPPSLLPSLRCFASRAVWPGKGQISMRERMELFVFILTYAFWKQLVPFDLNFRAYEKKGNTK